MLLAIFLTAPTQGFEAGYGERDGIDLEQTELPPRHRIPRRYAE